MNFLTKEPLDCCALNSFRTFSHSLLDHFDYGARVNSRTALMDQWWTETILARVWSSTATAITLPNTQINNCNMLRFPVPCHATIRSLPAHMTTISPHFTKCIGGSAHHKRRQKRRLMKTSEYFEQQPSAWFLSIRKPDQMYAKLVRIMHFLS